MLEIPSELLLMENILIYGATLFVVVTLILWNFHAVKKLSSKKTIMHYFPTWFSILLGVSAIYFSYSGVYTSNLDKLPSPLGIGIGTPIIILLIYSLRSKILSELIAVSDIRWFIVPQLSRISGYAILALSLSGLLANHVGYPIGIGDILTAISSIFILWLLSKPFTSQSKRTIFAWNTFGLVDFLVAATLTILTLPTSIQVFNTVPDSTMLAAVPVGVAPTFYVPLLYFCHFAVYKKLKSMKSV